LWGKKYLNVGGICMVLAMQVGFVPNVGKRKRSTERHDSHEPSVLRVFATNKREANATAPLK